MRRINRVLGDALALCELHQFSAFTILGKDLRSSAAMGDEDKPRHGIIVSRHKEKRLMMYRRVVGHLPDARAGRLIRENYAIRTDRRSPEWASRQAPLA